MTDRIDPRTETTAAYEQRAVRIGQLAADEGADHEQAHEIAAHTARLAMQEWADASYRPSRLLLAGVAIAAIAALGMLGLTVLETGALALDINTWPPLAAALVGVLALLNERYAPKLLARTGIGRMVIGFDRVEVATLQGYSDHRRILAQPGCPCFDDAD